MKRLHPYSGAVRALGEAFRFGSMGFFLAVMFGVVAGGDATNFLLVFALGLVGVIVGVSYGIARYLRFEYEASNGTFSIASGVFGRQERDIPYGRIQNVDIRRGILYRILGLAIVNMETAGGGDTEAVLNAVTIEEARRIQDAVAGYEERQAEATTAEAGIGEEATTADAGQAPSVEEFDAGGVGQDTDRSRATERGHRSGAGEGGPTRETVFELSVTDLALLAIVSFDPGGLALLIFSIPFGQEFAFEVLSTTVAALGGPSLPTLEAITGLPSLQLAFVLFVGAVQFIVAAWFASGVITAIKYYDFRLTRVGEDLRYERGLLGRYTGTIPLEKVQTITVRENVPMRRFGYAALELETAGYGPNQGSASNTAIPLDDREVVVALAERLSGVDYPTVERPPQRARRRYAVRMASIPIGLTIAIFAADAFLNVFPRWWIPLLALPLAPIAGHLMWKHRGHALTEEAFVARNSFWRRRTRFVPYYRIQTVIDTRTIFQRWRDLASVTADTASTASIVGGDATAYDVDEKTANDLHHSLRERLERDLRRHQRGETTPIGGDSDESLRIDLGESARTGAVDAGNAESDSVGEDEAGTDERAGDKDDLTGSEES